MMFILWIENFLVFWQIWGQEHLDQQLQRCGKCTLLRAAPCHALPDFDVDLGLHPAQDASVHGRRVVDERTPERGAIWCHETLQVFSRWNTWQIVGVLGRAARNTFFLGHKRAFGIRLMNGNVMPWSLWNASHTPPSQVCEKVRRAQGSNPWVCYTHKHCFAVQAPLKNVGRQNLP